jgi:RluA family pseudouridine synthase
VGMKQCWSRIPNLHAAHSTIFPEPREAMTNESGGGQQPQGNPDVDDDVVSSSKNNDPRMLRRNDDGAVVTQFRGWYALFMDRPMSTTVGSCSPSSFPPAEASSAPASSEEGQSDAQPPLGCFEVEAVDLATGVPSRKVMSLALPLYFEGRALIDPSVGKAICIEDDNCRSNCTMSADVSKQLTDEAVQKTKVEDWYLYKLHDKVIATAPAKDGSGNLVPYRKKQLVCRACLRSFPNWIAVENHISQKHRTTSRKRPRPGDTDPKEVDDAAVGNDDDDVWNRPLPIVYQDHHIAIVNKPQNMAVHGAKPSLMRSDLLMDLGLSKDEAGTAAWLRDHSIQPLAKPRPVHRLDATTGGILVIAKTVEAERHLKSALEDRKCQKKYVALLVGKMEDSTCGREEVDQKKKTIAIPIQGKESITDYKVVRHVESLDGVWFTLVEMWPRTGRHHQLRRHMKELGHPIVGDGRYKLVPKGGPGGDTNEVGSIAMRHVLSRLCLWAVQITLEHPFTKETQSFTIEEPEWLTNVMKRIETSSLRSA